MATPRMTRTALLISAAYQGADPGGDRQYWRHLTWRASGRGDAPGGLAYPAAVADVAVQASGLADALGDRAWADDAEGAARRLPHALRVAVEGARAYQAALELAEATGSDGRD